MALSSEDKKDVKGAMGSRMANKVARVTNDSLAKAKALSYKVNAGKGRKLSSKESAFKTHNWPTGDVDIKHERRLMGKDS
jgi:hypothetical protein